MLSAQSIESIDILAYDIGVPETYLQLISKKSYRIPVNTSLNTMKKPLIVHMYCAALFHIFSNVQFETIPLSLTSIPVLGLMAREGIDLKTNTTVVMQGNDLEQHYKLWRYFFSSYIYSKNLCARRDLINFMMLCVDYSFYLKSNFQRDVFLYYVFDWLTCGVTHSFDFSKIFAYAKENIVSNSCIEIVASFELFKQKMLPNDQGTNITSSLAAFFKIEPNQWQDFSCLLQNQNYSAVEQLCLELARE